MPWFRILQKSPPWTFGTMKSLGAGIPFPRESTVPNSSEEPPWKFGTVRSLGAGIPFPRDSTVPNSSEEPHSVWSGAWPHPSRSARDISDSGDSWHSWTCTFLDCYSCCICFVPQLGIPSGISKGFLFIYLKGCDCRRPGSVPPAFLSSSAPPVPPVHTAPSSQLSPPASRIANLSSNSEIWIPKTENWDLKYGNCNLKAGIWNL